MAGEIYGAILKDVPQTRSRPDRLGESGPAWSRF